VSRCCFLRASYVNWKDRPQKGISTSWGCRGCWVCRCRHQLISFRLFVTSVGVTVVTTALLWYIFKQAVNWCRSVKFEWNQYCTRLEFLKAVRPRRAHRLAAKVSERPRQIRILWFYYLTEIFLESDKGIAVSVSLKL